MTGQRLHHDLFLIAHDKSGKPLAHRSATSLALAGAVLIDLVLAGRVSLTGGPAVVVGRSATGDAVTDGLLTLIAGDRLGHDAPYWIRTLAEQDVHDRTREALVAAGLLVPVTRRRLGMLPYLRHEPADIALLVRASAGVRSAAEGRKSPDARSAALCGLMAVLQIERALYLGLPSLNERLRALATGHSPLVKELIGMVDTLVGEAAVAVYR
ncbi:GOLPH3/VPS74 family protein [Nonomuraea sp. SBT364]|uniref:GOLPH3/VPS74 family protein n=1 Tax=Nonomuraea sp. SBT364 TaxID=1580530 RepID=UPI00066EB2B5|nr:GPP34 family phosphoprotein [Nonomuraea sp. SBT364]